MKDWMPEGWPRCQLSYRQSQEPEDARKWRLFVFYQHCELTINNVDDILDKTISCYAEEEEEAKEREIQVFVHRPPLQSGYVCQGSVSVAPTRSMVFSNAPVIIIITIVIRSNELLCKRGQDGMVIVDKPSSTRMYDDPWGICIAMICHHNDGSIFHVTKSFYLLQNLHRPKRGVYVVVCVRERP